MAKKNLRKQKAKSKIQHIFDSGEKFICKNFVAYFYPTEKENLQSTIIASKKVGGAVVRSRCKRRLRELFRLSIKPNVSHLEIVLIARNALYLSNFQNLCVDGEKLSQKLIKSIAEHKERGQAFIIDEKFA